MVQSQPSPANQNSQEPHMLVAYYPMLSADLNDLMNPRYRCLCQTLHVTTGAKIVAIIELAIVGLSFSSVFYDQSTTTDGLQTW